MTKVNIKINYENIKNGIIIEQMIKSAQKVTARTLKIYMRDFFWNHRII